MGRSWPLPAVTAPVPAVPSSVVLARREVLPWLTRSSEDAEVKFLKLPVSGMDRDTPVDALGVEGDVGRSDPVLETALVGAVGVVAGVVVGAAGGVVAAVGATVSPKLGDAPCEVLEGSDAGTTPPVCDESLQRPWHVVTVESVLEVLLAAGRPFPSAPVVPVVVVPLVVVVVVPVVVAVPVVVVVPVVVGGSAWWFRSW